MIETIKIKYHADVEHIKAIEQGDWIDLRTAEEVTMVKGDYRRISLGVSMKLPEGYEAHVLPRSSTFEKYGILLVNSMGVIDESYCGNGDIWSFPALATRNVTIPKGERICQFRIVKHQPKILFKEVDHLEDKNRGGFGSTGRV